MEPSKSWGGPGLGVMGFRSGGLGFRVQDVGFRGLGS